MKFFKQPCEPDGLPGYEGLILTTIELKHKHDPECDEEPKDGDEVTFTNDSPNIAKGKNGEFTGKAAFLKNITQGEKGVFTATFVSTEKAAVQAINEKGDEDNTTLFCVHGCCGETDKLMGIFSKARTVFEEAKKKKEKKEKKCFPIPVLWPTSGINYKNDWGKNAPEAGAILAELMNGIAAGSFGKISLLCHSMGNRLVLNSMRNRPEIKEVFQNIFMVAADVPNNIFTENPEKGWWWNDFDYKTKAENMKSMLVDGGKIYVLKSEKDKALCINRFNPIVNPNLFFKPDRLGFSGAHNVRIKKGDVSRVINMETTPMIEHFQESQRKIVDLLLEEPDLMNGEFPKPILVYYYHNYPFQPWAVDFYNDVHSMAHDDLLGEYEQLSYPTVDQS